MSVVLPSLRTVLEEGRSKTPLLVISYHSSLAPGEAAAEAPSFKYRLLSGQAALSQLSPHVN